MRKFVPYLILLVLLLGGFFYYSKFGFGRIETKKSATLAEVKTASTDANIGVVIVPHLDLFAAERQKLLAEVGAKTKPKTIILVSANHLNSGTGNIQTTDENWQVENGEIVADKNVVEKLAASGLAQSDGAAFENEYGIRNILADIKTNFPDASILPIIIKDQAKKEEINNLNVWIDANCTDCLMVASIDFSDGCPAALARVHDSYSIQALENLEEDKIWNAETDSPQALYLSALVARQRQAANFHLSFNQNSGDLNHDDSMMTTSAVLGYYSRDAEDKTMAEPSTSFVIAGDVMLDRDVWNRFKDKGQNTIFDNFGTRPFKGTDLSLLNLEGPISADPIVGLRSDSLMSFKFSPQTPELLNYINVNAVSLANNHTSNQGNSGFANTHKALDLAGISYFGLPAGVSEDSLLQIDSSIPLSIIGVDALAAFDEQVLDQMIKTERAAGRFVIIIPHWGEEYQNKHVSAQENFAKEWTKAGADLIIGGHPHVTEDFSLVNQRPVVYSLGNFVFDQYFSKPTQEGLVVTGTISKDKIVLSFLPTKEKSVRPEFMTGQEKAEKIKSTIDLDSEAGFKKISGDTIEIER